MAVFGGDDYLAAGLVSLGVDVEVLDHPVHLPLTIEDALILRTVVHHDLPSVRPDAKVGSQRMLDRLDAAIKAEFAALGYDVEQLFGGE